jgi:hypothetical protein
MNHIILLGDSIFDNAAYVREGLEVMAHLRQLISPEWRVSLRAIDGSVVENVTDQTVDLPEDATHLIISAGGNNAILQADMLQQKVASSAEVLNMLADVSDAFEDQYSEMLRAVLSLEKPTAVCTIYFPRMPEPVIQKIAVAGLTIFNDVIIRQAFLAGIPLIDLRLVCNEDADYANEIEPSEAGGSKIANAIVRLISEHRFESHRTEAFI